MKDKKIEEANHKKEEVKEINEKLEKIEKEYQARKFKNASCMG